MQERGVQFLVNEGLNKYFNFLYLFASHVQVKTKVTSLALEVVMSLQWLLGLILNNF